jgi:EmrB/QacA subfamily drug resistance transporter
MSTEILPAPAAGADPPEGMDSALRRVVAVVVVGSFMTVMDTTIVNVALGTLGHQFHGSISNVQWVVTGYLLALALLIPVSGWAARRFGARRIYTAALALFTLGSFVCGLSSSLSALVVSRVLQGVGGGIIFPVGLIIMAQAAGPSRLGRASGMMFVPAVMAPVFGPTLGGVLIQYLGWSWIFFVNVPVGIIGVLAALRWLPADNRLGDAGRLDVLGFLLLGTGMPAITYGLSEIGITGGFDSARVIVPIVVGVALTALFVSRSRRIARPLLDVRIASNRVLAAALAVTFVLGAAFYGAYILMPLYFQEVRHDSVALAGALVGPQGVGAAIAMWWAGRRMDSSRAEPLVVAGVMLMVTATATLAMLGASSPVWIAPTAMFVRGLGVGLSIMPTMVIALGSVPASGISHASPVLNVVQRLSASIGTALFAVVLARARGGLPSPPTPSQLASAFSTANWWAVAITALTIFPCLVLIRAGSVAKRNDQVALHAELPLRSPRKEPRGA